MRVLDAGAPCAGMSRLGGSVASPCLAVAAFSLQGALARRWCSLCWRESLSAARWLRRALPSPPSARAVRLLDAGALCAGVVCTLSTRLMASALSAHASRRLHSARASWRLHQASPHGVCTCLSRTRWRSEIALVALQIAPALATGRKQVPASSVAFERLHQASPLSVCTSIAFERA